MLDASDRIAALATDSQNPFAALLATIARRSLIIGTWRRPGVLLAFCASVVLVGPAYGVWLTDTAGVRRRGELVEFRGSVADSDNVNGVAVVGDLLVIVTDEVKNPTIVQVLKKQGAAYPIVGEVELPAGKGDVDLEAAAADGSAVCNNWFARRDTKDNGWNH